MWQRTASRNVSARAKEFELLAREGVADEVLDVAHAADVFGDPEKGLEVTQAALALLDVRLEDVALAELLVALVPLLELRLDELRLGPPKEVGAKPLFKFCREFDVAGDQPMLKERRPYRHVGLAEAQAVSKAPRRVPDLQVQVPEDVEHRFDEALGPAAGLPRDKEQQVDVGVGRHLRPAVPAHGQHRDPRAVRLIRPAVEMAHRHNQHRFDDAVHQMAVGRDGRTRASRGLREGLCDFRPSGLHRGSEVLDRLRPDIPMLR